MPKETIEYDHLTTLRVPKELHEWVMAYAKKWRTSPSFVYRHAVWKFRESVGSAR